MFTLHIALNFLKVYLGSAALLVVAIFGVVILLIGLFHALTERD